MSIQEIHFDAKGKVTSTTTQDERIRRARPDVASDFPDITEVEEIRAHSHHEDPRETVDMGTHRIKKLVATGTGEVRFTDVILGPHEEDGFLRATTILVSEKVYREEEINNMGIVLGHRTFRHTPDQHVPVAANQVIASPAI